MSLLVDMMTNTLDPGYAAAAARRAAANEPAPKGRQRVRRLAALVAAGLAALILVTAAGQASRSAPAQARIRADLVRQVRQQTEQVDGLQRQVSTLSAALGQLRQLGLGGSAAGRRLADQLNTLQLATGDIAVIGPGVRVTLRDAPAPTSGVDSPAQGGQVLDSDLQHVVNALWASGAEAVGVNGQRVTALTSIRAAGDAIVVDFRPLDPPYVITAIGDPDSLEQSFVSTPAASALRTYSQAYGLGFEVKGLGSASLPAAAAPALYAAQPGVMSSAQPSSGGSS